MSKRRFDCFFRMMCKKEQSVYFPVNCSRLLRHYTEYNVDPFGLFVYRWAKLRSGNEPFVCPATPSIIITVSYQFVPTMINIYE